MKIYFKLFGIFGVILLIQISCSSKNYHEPKGQIEKLATSKYQKNPYMGPGPFPTVPSGGGKHVWTHIKNIWNDNVKLYTIVEEEIWEI